MSGTHNDPVYGGDFPASRAVDGNNDPIALKVDNSCAVSTAGDNPWWAVDLGAALVVVGVLFTNRGETLGNVSSSTSAVFELSKRKKSYSSSQTCHVRCKSSNISKTVHNSVITRGLPDSCAILATLKIFD